MSSGASASFCGTFSSCQSGRRASTTPSDGAHRARLVERLFGAAHHDAIPAAPLPADLRSLFITLAPYATASAQAAILRRDAASPEPRFLDPRLPPADLVVTVHLEAPHLLTEVRIATDARSIQGTLARVRA